MNLWISWGLLNVLDRAHLTTNCLIFLKEELSWGHGREGYVKEKCKWFLKHVSPHLGNLVHRKIRQYSQILIRVFHDKWRSFFGICMREWSNIRRQHIILCVWTSLIHVCLLKLYNAYPMKSCLSHTQGFAQNSVLVVKLKKCFTFGRINFASQKTDVDLQNCLRTSFFPFLYHKSQFHYIAIILLKLSPFSGILQRGMRGL